MPRIKFKKKTQVKFLDNIRKEIRVDWPKFARILKTHPRSLSNWRRGEYTLPETVFKKCTRMAKEKVEIPPYKVLPDFWSVEKAARKAGLIVAQKYGGPGTPEGRRKGGLVSQQRRRLHPELYQHCNLRKKISKPKNTPELAEFLGIVLGDGGINSNYQVVISLHKENDKRYISSVCKLIKKLFGIKAVVYNYHSLRSQKVVGVTISSASIVELLLRKGLRKGNKIKQQVGVPGWIRKKIEFAKCCLRGLIDTDGGVYYHKHKVHGCNCFNIGLQLTSKSNPILKFTRDALEKLSFTPKLNKKSVNLYREQEVYRYAKEIGFHNPYHIERLKKFSKEKEKFLGGVRRIGKAHAWRA